MCAKAVFWFSTAVKTVSKLIGAYTKAIANLR